MKIKNELLFGIFDENHIEIINKILTFYFIYLLFGNNNLVVFIISLSVAGIYVYGSNVKNKMFQFIVGLILILSVTYAGFGIVSFLIHLLTGQEIVENPSSTTKTLIAISYFTLFFYWIANTEIMKNIYKLVLDTWKKHKRIY